MRQFTKSFDFESWILSDMKSNKRHCWGQFLSDKENNREDLLYYQIVLTTEQSMSLGRAVIPCMVIQRMHDYSSITMDSYSVVYTTH